MNDAQIMTMLSFAVALIAVLGPTMAVVLRLNGTITRLTEALDNLEENWKTGHSDLSGRVAIHGKQIDELEKTAVAHDVRIKNLEGGN